jgi:peptidoglycan L-alanyl-D-glutamate endopeptidase CwlK
MINSRSLLELSPEAVNWFERWRAEVERKTGLMYGTAWIVTSTYRDQAFQDALYAQGRTSPGLKVTWTRESRHTSRRAWDIAIKKPDGSIDWNVAKADVDLDQLPDYLELALVGKEVGLNCGYFWPKVDAVHYELPG